MEKELYLKKEEYFDSRALEESIKLLIKEFEFLGFNFTSNDFSRILNKSFSLFSIQLKINFLLEERIAVFFKIKSKLN